MPFSLPNLSASFSCGSEPTRTMPNVFYVFTAFVLGGMSVVNVLLGETFFAWLLFGLCLTTLAIFAVAVRTKCYYATDMASLVIITVFCLYLLASGGVDNNGHLWMYVAPSMVMFTFGLRKGIACMTIMLIGALMLLFGPLDGLVATAYPMSFKIRLPISLFTTGLFAVVAEYARVQAQGKLLTLTEELDRSARTDALTGLANRRGATELLQQEYYRALRNKKEYSIVLCDIDYFKEINDQYGHECGDTVLSKVAQKLRMVLRKQDIAARWGGEEFLILLPETNHAGALVAAEKMRRAIVLMHCQYEGAPISLTASFGVHTATFEDPAKEIRIADEKLYKAKREGRNCVVGDVTISSLPLSESA